MIGGASALFAAQPPRLEIRHRLLAARSVTLIMDRGFRFTRRYRPEPRLIFARLGMQHDAADVLVADEYVVVVV